LELGIKRKLKNKREKFDGMRLKKKKEKGKDRRF